MNNPEISDRFKFVRQITSTPQTLWGYAWLFTVYASLVISMSIIIYSFGSHPNTYGGNGELGFASFIFSLWFANFLFVLQSNLKSSSYFHTMKLIKQYDEDQRAGSGKHHEDMSA